MPKVGMKEFSYSAKGMAMAKKEAKKTGKKMVNNRFYGRVTVDGVRTFNLQELR